MNYRRLTNSDILELSGIKENPSFQTFDWALPMNKDFSYPFNGLAIAVYWKKQLFPEIVSYAKLAKMAIEKVARENPNGVLLGHLEKVEKHLLSVSRERLEA
jgi:ABC-type uncharacterized transport system YnjBCD substrate-binding protein